MISSMNGQEIRMIGVDELAETLGRIEMLRLRFVLEARGAGRLPSYLGSTLRGGLAGALKQLVCSLPRTDCGRCLLRFRCAYSVLFETPRPSGLELLRGQQKLPHPIVLNPPHRGAHEFVQGDELSFGMSLFGHSAAHLPFLVVAAQKMAESGLGKMRIPFELIRIDTSPLSGSPIKIFEEGCLITEPSSEKLSQSIQSSSPSSKATIELLTPTRLVVGGQLTTSPTLSDILRSLSTRALSMLALHCGEALDLDIEAIVKLGATVSVNEQSLELVMLDRYSSRQKRSIPLDGLVGSLSFEGESLKEIWPLLVVGRELHLGKNTIFGLGKYQLS